jgi:hypothetical protein
VRSLGIGSIALVGTAHRAQHHVDDAAVITVPPV